MRSPRKTQMSSQQALAGRPTDALFVFALKVLVPLVPILGLFIAITYFLNLEITGVYEGSSEKTGFIRLLLDEEQDRLTGNLILRADDRYKIVEGKMIDDTHMEIVCRKNTASAISGLEQKSKLSYNSNNNESSIPENISATPALVQEEAIGPEIKFQGTKDQNTINGTLHMGTQVANVELIRNSFSAFFGWRWFHRILKSIGIKG